MHPVRYFARTLLPISFAISASNICFSGSLSWRAALTSASAKPWRSSSSCSSCFKISLNSGSLLWSVRTATKFLTCLVVPNFPVMASSTARLRSPGDRRIFQDTAQLIAFLEQSLKGVQFLQSAGGIEMAGQVAQPLLRCRRHHNIGERAGVGAYYGSHLPAILSAIVARCAVSRQSCGPSTWSVLVSTLIC